MIGTSLREGWLGTVWSLVHKKYGRHTASNVSPPPGKTYRFSSRIDRDWPAARRPKISMLSQADHDENQPHKWMHSGLKDLTS